MDLTELLAIAHTRPLNDEELMAVNRLDSGFSTTLGLSYTFIGPETVRGQLDVSPALLQPFGIVNGGVYCAIGETLGSVAGLCAAGAPVVGVNNSTNFMRSCGDGTILAEARAVHLGRSTQVWEIDMQQQGKLLARTSLRTQIVQA